MVQVTLKFDPRQQTSEAVRDLADYLDSQAFNVDLEPHVWPWAGSDPYHLSLFVAAAGELAKGFFEDAGKELLDWIRLRILVAWIRLRILVAWKKPALAGAPAPFELEVQTDDLTLILRSPDPHVVDKALASVKDAIHIAQAGRRTPIAVRFDSGQSSWVEVDLGDSPESAMQAERSRDRTY